MLPTVIDLRRYPWSPTTRLGDVNGPLRIVWIGSPSTAYYLKALADPLRQLAARSPFVLRVIGASVELPGVVVEHVDWRETTEVRSIAECDIGVMPLADSPWERGKCGYKLIQYMACGLPVVASPIGVNVDIVTEGVNGFLADGSEQWVAALERLLIQEDLRCSLGEQGRRRVESTYSLQVTAPMLANLLKKAADCA
jgi:glycosyltransferase involved in cell wall biosynthesis